MRLTPRQLQVVNVIRDATESTGCAPTLAEMAEALGICRITVHEHVQRLIGRGVLRHTPRRARSLEIDESALAGRPTALPLAGTIAAGQPLEALETIETISVHDLVNTDAEIFALRVRGDSMIDEHIRDGDYVIVRRAATAADGQTVVALLPDGEATLKKFYREKGRIRLQPANPDLNPLYVREVTIQGIVIGVLRKY